MNLERWTSVDRYFVEELVRPGPEFGAALAANTEAGLPGIDVSAPLGKLLHLLALTMGARRILEVGTLGGYSTIWLAQALPANGHIITLEADPRHVEVAAGNLQRAGVADRVRIVAGPALESLPRIAAESGDPFDLVFIDADKPSTPEYFAWALKLTRPGSLIIADNVVREGEVVNAESQDERVQGMRRFVSMVACEPRVSATAVQTVGTKGYDGFVIARVRSAAEQAADR